MEIVYKALNKNLTCTMGKGVFQYKVGEWIDEKSANVGCNGLHACLNVLDCLGYYGDIENSVYYMALADGDISEDGQGTRISCTRMKLVKELDATGIVMHALHFIAEHPWLDCSSRHVSKECGNADKHFVIVRGKNPMARGPIGAVLGFIKENTDNNIIEAVNILHVDGKDILPGKYYRMNGLETGGLL